MKNYLLIIFLFTGLISNAQSKELTIESSVMGYYQGLYPSSLRSMQWLTDVNKYAHRINDSYFILPASALPNSKVAEQITIENIKLDSMDKLPYLSSISSTEVTFTFKNDYYTYCYKGTNEGQYSAISIPKDAANLDINKDAKAIAYTKDNGLYIATSTNEIPIVTNEDKNIVSGQAIHRFEFGISKGTFWSPKGNSLAFYQKDESKVADYPLLDITTRTGSLTSIKYPMAGENSEHGSVGIYDLTSQKTIYLKTDKPYDYYVSNVTWDPSENFIYIIEINRGQDHFWFNQYNAKTGDFVKTLFEEKHTTFLQPVNDPYFIPGKNDEFVYLSERDGFFNLYHYNTDGTLINQLTNFKWEVTGILGADLSGANLYFEGTGEDARELHTYVVNIKSKKVTKLTESSGVHHCQLSWDDSYIIDNFSSVDIPKKVCIIDTKKQKTIELFSAENPLADYKSGKIELGTLKANDGTTLYTRMIKPSDFDSTKQYPVLVYVYGGPGVQLINNSWNAGASLWMNWLAEQGYIVYTLDNHGSSNRGRRFKEVIHRQLGTVEIEDQLTGIEHLKTLPYVNSKRLAVHGWSFGGFMTTSLMLRTPGTFTTGVAGGPVIDWKWYEIMYGERYMDTPEENPEGYEKASLLNYVKNLEGKLLMIHGTIDDVVVMQHNLAFVQKCVEEGVQIDFFPYPMHPHNVRGKDRVHLMTKVLTYIMENNN